MNMYICHGGWFSFTDIAELLGILLLAGLVILVFLTIYKNIKGPASK